MQIPNQEAWHQLPQSFCILVLSVFRLNKYSIVGQRPGLWAPFPNKPYGQSTHLANKKCSPHKMRSKGEFVQRLEEMSLIEQISVTD